MVTTTREKALEDWRKFFSTWKMWKSETSIETLQLLWNKGASSSIIEQEFRHFLSCIEEEYSNLDEGFNHPKEKHRKRCFDFLEGIVASLLNSSLEQWKKMYEQCLPLFESSAIASDSWNQLIETTTKAPPKSYKEAIHAASVEYLNKVEGMYDKLIRICYIWAKFKNNEGVTHEQVSTLRMKQIQRYFKINYGNECLFEGYNFHIRNAVAHTSFHFDEKNEKMIYEDIPAKWKGEFTDPEIMVLSSKIMNVVFLVTILFALTSVNDILYV